MAGRGPTGDSFLSRAMAARRATGFAIVAAMVVATACASPGPPQAVPSLSPSAVPPRPTSPASDAAASEAAPPDPGRMPRVALGTRRPAWLGRRVLPRTADGYGEVRPTPPVLRTRRFPTIDLLPPPTTAAFSSSVDRVPARVVRRSTWTSACPVGLDDLRYVTVSFWGFDDRAHTGELLVNADVAADVVEAFRRLHRRRFPIEEMRVVDAPELDLPPTGDGNNTTAFVCRPVRGASSWSQHAYGRAIDVNPFFNPYVKGDVVLPELASYFTDRAVDHPGMHAAGGASVRAFDAIGWAWGGRWSSPKDWMHFSATGG